MGAKKEYEFVFEEPVKGMELFEAIERAVNHFDYEIERGKSIESSLKGNKNSEEVKAENFRIKADSGSLAGLIIPKRSGLYYEGESENLLTLRTDIKYSSFPFKAHRYERRSKSGLKEQDVITTNEFVAETYKELGLEVNEDALKPVK